MGVSSMLLPSDHFIISILNQNLWLEWCDRWLRNSYLQRFCTNTFFFDSTGQFEVSQHEKLVN
jgi:hypothetical protein